MIAHTSGPWSINGSQIFAPDGAILAQVCNPGWRDSDYPLDENARLMAAAPCLLAAAKFALQNLLRNLASEAACGQPFMGDDEHEAIQILREAIASATASEPIPYKVTELGRRILDGGEK